MTERSIAERFGITDETAVDVIEDGDGEQPSTHRWCDAGGGVWEEHPDDPEMIRFAHDANGNAPTYADYWTKQAVSSQFGELTRPDDEIVVETYLNGKRTPVPPANELLEARKLREAAAELENLTVMMKQAVLDLRANSERASRGGQTHASESLNDAYARAYYLRRELGRVVATLGVGVPVNYRLRGVETAYRALIQD